MLLQISSNLSEIKDLDLGEIQSIRRKGGDGDIKEKHSGPLLMGQSRSGLVERGKALNWIED